MANSCSLSLSRYTKGANGWASVKLVPRLVQRRREKRDAQQQQLAERKQALRRTSLRAASAEEELRRGAQHTSSLAVGPDGELHAPPD
jgi:hypothetical protein